MIALEAVCVFYIPIKCAAPMTREPQRANIEPVNNVWSSYFYAADEKSVLASPPRQNARLLHEEEKTAKSKGRVARVRRETHVFPVPFPSRLRSGC